MTLRVHYNVQPWVGVLTWSQDREFWRWEGMAKAASEAFPLPALKPKKDEGEKKKRKDKA